MRIITLGVGAAGLMYALVACGGGKADTDTTGTATGTTQVQDTEDTYQGPSCSTLGKMTMDMEFAWDDAAGATRSILIEGNEYSSFFSINLGTPSWGGDMGMTSQYCSVVFFMDGATEAPWSDTDGWWIALESAMEAGNSTTDCDSFDWCDGEFYYGDAVSDFAIYDATFAHGGDIDTYLWDYFGPYLTPEENYWGGALGGSLVGTDAGYDPIEVIGYGYEVDTDFNLIFDGSGYAVNYDKYSAQSASALINGYYVTFVPWIWTFN